jgi:protein-disulfide isomerase
MTKSAATTTRPRRKTGGSNIGIWIIGASAAIVLLVVLLMVFNQSPPAAAIKAPDVPAEWLNRNVMGDPNAPITVQIWEDFLCPACRQWTTTVEPQVIDQYVKSGQIQLEFRQFPLSGHAPGSNMAAMASLCAADQGAFWTYHNRLFMGQDQGQAGFTIDALTRYADELDLDSRALLECMSSQKYRDEVAASANEALQLGLNATPSVLVNGTRMTNPFDLNEFAALVEAAPAN